MFTYFKFRTVVPIYESFRVLPGKLIQRKQSGLVLHPISCAIRMSLINYYLSSNMKRTSAEYCLHWPPSTLCSETPPFVACRIRHVSESQSSLNKPMISEITKGITTTENQFSSSIKKKKHQQYRVL